MKHLAKKVDLFGSPHFILKSRTIKPVKLSNCKEVCFLRKKNINSRILGEVRPISTPLPSPDIKLIYFT